MRVEIIFDDDLVHKSVCKYSIEEDSIGAIEVIDMLARTMLAAGFQKESVLEAMDGYLEDNGYYTYEGSEEN